MTRPLSLAESLNGALADLMEDDPSVVLIGQDIGRLGGVFRVTKGLQNRFGAGRVRDAILAESAIVGQAIGMALSGLKPVCEIQFDGFVYLAMNQIVTQAARMTTRWNDQIALNLVVRVPVGGGIRAVEHHSESNEALFAHIPGLHVAYPSCPADAAAMLKYSCGLGSPVIFFEPKRLYFNRKQQPRLGTESDSPAGARIVRRGSDITVVGFGALLEEVLMAADRLADRVDAEVIDLRWIAPMDTDTVLESVTRTGRLLVVHEAVKFGGIGAEVVATVAERGGHRLKAAPRRLAPPRQVYPPADYENDYLIDVSDIVSAIEEMCG
ncbi:pyruvate dehydrogenase [Mycolicibacterium agri]|nr:transketolase C-terminal domain-containing protein [Mycolicibacterium agri]PEG41770.1 pyruvate dehydrogenase [Mycolicibacterium agri]